MSNAESNQNNQAIEKAMNMIKAHGMSEEHMSLLFKDEKDITMREAMLISHIKHLENKVYMMSSILDEISLIGGEQGLLAQSALENIVKVRKLR